MTNESRELTNGYYWMWRDDEWEMCYKSSSGIDSITYPDRGTDKDFDETRCIPINPPHQP